jgi:hypothetical protein
MELYSIIQQLQTLRERYPDLSITDQEAIDQACTLLSAPPSNIDWWKIITLLVQILGLVSQINN